MKHLIKITIVALIAVSFTSCNKKTRPNYEYMPNMYESVAYETYQESDAFANGKEGQLPVEGTISRGYMPFDYAGDTDGYNLAKAELTSPLYSNPVDLNRCKELYNIYRCIFHGDKGELEGRVVKR